MITSYPNLSEHGPSRRSIESLAQWPHRVTESLLGSLGSPWPYHSLHDFGIIGVAGT